MWRMAQEIGSGQVAVAELGVAVGCLSTVTTLLSSVGSIRGMNRIQLKVHGEFSNPLQHLGYDSEIGPGEEKD